MQARRSINIPKPLSKLFPESSLSWRISPGGCNCAVVRVFKFVDVPFARLWELARLGFTCIVSYLSDVAMLEVLALSLPLNKIGLSSAPVTSAR